MPACVTIQAPAKLNLALSVGHPVDTPRGPMHPICSWMVTVDLFDDLTLSRLDDGSLSRYAILWHRDAKRRTPIDWSITKDLAVRAHLALEKRLARALPVQLKLEKRIPVGAGLGGGSSDAAALLRGLNELFELGLSLDELADLGSTIGSDVPFLVHGGSALVEGIGDQLTLHNDDASAQVHAVLAFPDAQCATAAVYGLFDSEVGSGHAARDPDSDRVRSLIDAGRLRPDSPFNDLAHSAMISAPRLRDHLLALSQLAERPAHITGSGAAIFVLCDNTIHASALADAVNARLGLPAVAVSSCTIAHESIR